jgi:aspartyl-tRNA(Asn)/glutamyl-tRNA(Gln) amidotransferase subunit C
VKVTEAWVRQVAGLARLALTDEEVHRAVHDLSRILHHVEAVSGIDLQGHDPAGSEPVEVERLRDDEPGPVLPRGALLKNAPRHDGTFFLVPKVLGSAEAPSARGPGGTAS